jgi:hypothetical protein
MPKTAQASVPPKFAARAFLPIPPRRIHKGLFSVLRDLLYLTKESKIKWPVANIGSYFIRVSEVLQVQFPLASVLPGDKDALRTPLRNIAENVSTHFKKSIPMSLEDKKKDRFLFLKKLYDTTDGNSGYIVDMWELGSELEFNREKIHNLVDYLTDEGLLEPKTLGGGISITHYGIVEIEDSLTHPDSSTDHFLPINVIHIENMTNSAIQQGASHSTQTINFNADKSEDLKKIIFEIENIKEQITLDRLVFDELVSEIDTLKSQIKSPKPKSIIVTESLRTIRSILEGVAGNAATPLIIGMIDNMIK